MPNPLSSRSVIAEAAYVAELQDFTSFIMQLTDALHAPDRLVAALKGFHAITDACVVHVYRLFLESGRRQTIATADYGRDARHRPLVRELGQSMVPQDLRNVKIGTLWTLSELDRPLWDKLEMRGRLWVEDRGFRDAGLFVLGRNGNSVDVAEFYCLGKIHGRLRTRCEILCSLCATAWASRPKGRVSAWLRSAPQITPRSEVRIKDDPLSMSNPWKLTAAEMRICALIRDGSDIADIVTRTGNSISTVRTHLRNIYSKAQIPGHVALVRLLIADRSGLSDHPGFDERSVNAGTNTTYLSVL